LISVNNYAFLIGELPLPFHHLVQFSIKVKQETKAEKVEPIAAQ